ncbi:MAG: DUF2147 domain-containing protein [Enhydrobacter sp.]|nr:MAG: DUF2147 domain-containing protein [Enhydrobacter sp.]
MTMRTVLLAACLGSIASMASAQDSKVVGTWLTASGTAQVKIGPCPDAASGPVCGFIVGLINPKGPDGKVVAPEVATDYRNADPKLRDRKVIGMPLIWGFKKTGDPNVFEGGQIYNGENGKIYSANIGVESDGRLRLRGYSGSPMFGETQYWTRVQ